MPRARVLLGTNVLVSGIVFTKGNEHKIIRLTEDGRATLVLPETVLIEGKEVLKEKFPGYEKLFDIFLGRLEFELVQLSDILSKVEPYEGKVRDKKDASIYAAVATAKADYAITGDAILRVDLSNSQEIIKNTRVCSNREFLREF
jgi:putative PIN family toxin of toxin-antitoxin system